MHSVVFFFFSSRRRHTRYWRDWSSDVCSSDLGVAGRRPRRRRTDPAPIPRPGGPIMTESASVVAELGTVLGIWAHPDDEAYLSGGLMALARDGGSRVACVTEIGRAHV